MEYEKIIEAEKKAEMLKAEIKTLIKKRRALMRGNEYKISVPYSQDFNKMLKLAKKLKPIEKRLIKANISYMPFLEH